MEIFESLDIQGVIFLQTVVNFVRQIVANLIRHHSMILTPMLLLYMYLSFDNVTAPEAIDSGT